MLNRTAAFDASVKTRAGSAAGHPEPGSGSASAGRSGAGVANGTRYRYIGDEPLKNAGSAGAGNAGANASTTATAKTRSRPNSEYVLYSNGEPVAVNSDNGVSYFGTDILGSVRSVTDRNGQVKASYEYDAFGTPYLSNLENDVGFGYTGKIFDSDTGLYDYGFRDYAPNSARFTTIDPVRDGANWFSYVVNDPVNYVDLFGLTPGFTNNTSKVFIVIPENDYDIDEKMYTKLIIDKNQKYDNPIDGIYDPETGMMYKVSTGQTLEVSEDSNGNLIFNATPKGIAIKGGLNSILKGYSLPDKAYYPDKNGLLPKDLEGWKSRTPVKNASEYYDQYGVPLPDAVFRSDVFTNSTTSITVNSFINNSINFNNQGVYGDTSVVPTNDMATALENLGNFLRNSVAIGIKGFVLSCSK